MLRLYLDAAGHEDNTDVLAVAGYLSSEEQWAAIEHEWRTLLHANGLPFFHMTDCMAGTGAFARWDRGRRTAMAEDFITIINRHVRAGVGTFVSVPDFRNVLEPHRKMMTYGSPTSRFPALSFCVRVTMEYLHNVVLYCEPLTEPIAVTIERGDKWQTQMLSYCNWLVEQPRWCPNTYGLIVPGEKTVPGLQAADILANRTYDAGRTYKGSGPLERSFWIERLDQIERGDEWKHFVIRFGGRETLEQIVETLRPWWLSVAGAGS